jgi:hypothetical protein
MRRTAISRYVIVAAVIATTSLIWVKSSNAQVEQLVSACVAGNPAACQRLMQIARSACLNGDSNGCSLAAQIAALQVPGASSSGYPDHYDPLAPYRDTLRDTGDYIRSYCSDPKMAAQLQAFGYCR